jgi:hypothetical protein
VLTALLSISHVDTPTSTVQRRALDFELDDSLGLRELGIQNNGLVRRFCVWPFCKKNSVEHLEKVAKKGDEAQALLKVKQGSGNPQPLSGSGDMGM